MVLNTSETAPHLAPRAAFTKISYLGKIKPCFGALELQKYHGLDGAHSEPIAFVYFSHVVPLGQSQRCSCYVTALSLAERADVG